MMVDAINGVSRQKLQVKTLLGRKLINTKRIIILQFNPIIISSPEIELICNINSLHS